MQKSIAAVIVGRNLNALGIVRRLVRKVSLFKLSIADWKQTIKRMFYWSGALTAFHYMRNRDVLTVAMFHRVLARSDPRFSTAHPRWTVTDEVFERCLGFFRKHYNFVSVDDVKAAQRRERRLPPRPLLITFDDGYADNLDYALPLLRKHKAPAVVFVSSDVIGQTRRVWTEELLLAWESGHIHTSALTALHEALFGGSCAANGDWDAVVVEIVRRGAGCDPQQAQAVLSSHRIYLGSTSERRQMLDAAEILHLARHGVAIGAHGKTHTALPFANDLTSELKVPRDVLNEILAREPGQCADTLSFPHGACTPEIAEQVLAEGYELMFTVTEVLCQLADGFVDGAVLGRINVDIPPWTADGDGWLATLAHRFFTRPHAPPVLVPASSQVSSASMKPGGNRKVTP